jgi:hypothetical protein
MVRHSFVTGLFATAVLAADFDSGQGVSAMPIEMRPAIPAALPYAPVAHGRRERLLRWFRAAVTVLAATVAVLGAAMTAVILGIS